MAVDEVQGRILGSLVEKELATPQQYPLTANALLLACNQSSNREPVMQLTEGDVQRGLDTLKAQRLVRFVFPSHGRSTIRYRHVLDESFGLDERQRALLGVLLLRGPQTVGELRARTERLAPFDRLQDVEDELRALAARSEPLVVRLERRPGQKEERYRQVLADAPAGPAGDPGASRLASTDDRHPDDRHPDDRHPDDRHPDDRQPDGRQPGDRSPGADRAGDGDVRSEVEDLRAALADIRHQVAALQAEVADLRTSLGG